MAKRLKFGQTWWGKQWLNALNDIDYSNRLPRGRTYANKGAVKEFELYDKGITAKVQGSRIRPYKQNIQLTPFTEKEKSKILELVKDDLNVLSALLNRKMPKSLLALLQANDIDLFPQDFRSLDMECSCPDWAVPCKHLAAVVYLFANEIDRDPFLLFRLKGLDLLAELEAAGLYAKETAQKIPQFEDLWQKKAATIKAPLNEEAFKQLSYDFEDTLSQVFHLLDEVTVFYQGKSFKTLLRKLYKNTSKQLGKEVLEDCSEKVQVLKTVNKIYLEFDEAGYFNNLMLQKETDYEPLLKNNGNQVLQLQALLESTANTELWEYPDGWIALYTLYHFSRQLTMHHSFVPRLLQVGEEHRIEWIPAAMHQTVRKMQEALLEFCPGDLLQIKENKKKTHFLPPKEQLRLLVDLFIGEWFQEANMDVISAEHDNNTPVLTCFIERYPLDFSLFNESHIETSIHHWLSKFYLQEKRFTPVIKVEEYAHEFELTLWLEDKEAEDQLMIPFRNFLKQSKYKEHRLLALQDMEMLSSYLPALKGLLADEQITSILLNGVEFEQLFFEVLPVMELLGVTLLLPKALRKIVFPALSMKVEKQTASDAMSFMSLPQMLEFNWQIAMGEELITPEEFRKLVAQKAGLVKIRDQYVHLDEKILQKLLKQLSKPPKVNPQELVHAALSDQYKGASVLVDQKVKDLMQELQAIEEVAAPAGLRAQLRPYQQTGYAWLYKNTRMGMGALLADDMGLGKTLQVITLLLQAKEEGQLDDKKALITVPTTLLSNWEKEVAKFAPALKAHVYHGPKRAIPEDFDLLLTSYGILRSDKNILKKYRWRFMTIDEAQHIKNPSTAQTKAVKSINADHYIAMSGTPVENRLSEYWSIMDFVNKGYLGTLKGFEKQYAKPIQQDRDQEKMEAFRQITAPFILRRLKSDKNVIKDLPEKLEVDYFVSLEKEQAAVYENLVAAAMQKIKDSEGIERRGLVLSLMMGLKQICNHPYQYLKKGNAKPEASGKTKLLFDLLNNIREKQEKVLIFTQYKQMGDLLQQWIGDAYGREPLFLHGGTSRKKRDEMVEAFQNNRQDRIFILSLKAGGTGLNLTAANHVIHYDLWWNPAVETQATDRAYRIGQQKNVLVYRMLCEGTLEERIDAMIKSKKELAELTVATGESWLGDLSDEELSQMVELGVD